MNQIGLRDGRSPLRTANNGFMSYSNKESIELCFCCWTARIRECRVMMNLSTALTEKECFDRMASALGAKNPVTLTTG
jgi:hypothetical protein